MKDNRIVPAYNYADAPEVLLTRCHTDDHAHTVEMTAWHDGEDGEKQQVVYIGFNSKEMALRFIADFSQESAAAFIESFDYDNA